MAKRSAGKGKILLTNPKNLTPHRRRVLEETADDITEFTDRADEEAITTEDRITRRLKKAGYHVLARDYSAATTKLANALQDVSEVVEEITSILEEEKR